MARPGEGTKFTLDRKLFTSDIWFASPWKLKVWIYLLGHANHEDRIVMGIPLKRGELICSLRTLRNQCAYKIGNRTKRPSVDTIKRISDALAKESRIVRRTVHGLTVLSINNYSALQPVPEPRTVRLNRTHDRTAVVQDKYSKNSKEKKISKKIFKKPMPAEVTEYAKSIDFQLDGQHFCDYYETRGWMLGKSHMKSWQAAVRTWKRNQNKQANTGKSTKTPALPSQAAFIFEQEFGQGSWWKATEEQKREFEELEAR